MSFIRCKLIYLSNCHISRMFMTVLPSDPDIGKIILLKFLVT